ncbi:MAG: plasmid maintenance protein CcdB [Dokdonella sp.]|nr:MAG: plasmid maintenance protein CcdB [Gammaproteobacteria bacterium]TXI76869.1 MAG: plasmid maintenance protein CcdB [Dokdonella sp.]
MKSVFDTAAPKRPVNLSLNQDLVAKARRLTENLSAEVEGLLAEFVERQAAERDEHAQSLRRSAHVANAFLERNGSLSDEFSAF